MSYEFRFKDGRIHSLNENRSLTSEQVSALLDGLAQVVWVDHLGHVTVLAGDDEAGTEDGSQEGHRTAGSP